jgi:hypothetical protein
VKIRKPAFVYEISQMEGNANFKFKLDKVDSAAKAAPNLNVSSQSTTLQMLLFQEAAYMTIHLRSEVIHQKFLEDLGT